MTWLLRLCLPATELCNDRLPEIIFSFETTHHVSKRKMMGFHFHFFFRTPAPALSSKCTLASPTRKRKASLSWEEQVPAGRAPVTLDWGAGG